jgi:hypothetical protein
MPVAGSTVVAILQPSDPTAILSGYRVLAHFRRRPVDDVGLASAEEVTSGEVDPKLRQATLAIPATGTLDGSVVFRALAPTGEERGALKIAAATLGLQVTIPIEFVAPPALAPSIDPAFGRPRLVKGRVIDRRGRSPAGQKQVVIWGATATNPQAADYRALFATETDAKGHFSGPYPLGRFTAALGEVAVSPEQVASSAIHLGEQGAFPESVLLVIDVADGRPTAGLPADGATATGKDKDCHCDDAIATPRDPDAGDLARADGTFSTDIGQGRCVDFTVPNRTLDEFSFSYLLRTSEPEVRALTLYDEVPAHVLAGGSILEDFIKRAAPGTNPLRDLVLPPGTTGAPATGAPAGTSAAVRAFSAAKLDARGLAEVTRDPRLLTKERLAAAERESIGRQLAREVNKAIPRPPSRSRLDGRHPIDWDDDPTIYQATTIAHGHVLRIKQEWVADGYSMGKVLYSLPLAPGQKKQIAVVDWERRESTIRGEETRSDEGLENVLSRDRDIGELVTASLQEHMHASSRASTSSVSAGLGIGAIIPPVGGVLGVSGGSSSASSSASQDSSRQAAANSLQTLRDRTAQSASAFRSIRSSVIHTVAQGERVTATTETVANYNHCHAITVQYFEVLRHLIVRQRLTDVQECLFVPLLLSRFTESKALRWRNSLKPSVPRHLRGGFDALERMAANYDGSDFPPGAYADERLDDLEGELQLRFELVRPRDNDQGEFLEASWTSLGFLFPFNAREFHHVFLRRQQRRDRIFLQQLGPKIASAIVDGLQFTWIDANNVESAPLPIDPTLLSRFANEQSLAVSLRLDGQLPEVARKDIRRIKILDTLRGGRKIAELLPAGSRIVVEAGAMRYRTAYSSGYLFASGRIRNDLNANDPVVISTPLSREELRRPREEDRELARNLLDFLNENIERYHHVLWATMSPDRRYMLLDGFEAPNANGRSVASVVENKLIGIVGNSLVLPVARGTHLDPTYAQNTEKRVDLLEHYQPTTPVEPLRVAIPTRGVYAEAVMGACNSCEHKDESRFWRWEESPIPDGPTAIEPISTGTRRTDPADVTPTQFPQPIIAMQNAPAAPDPTGLGAALSLVGQANAFRDLTGLDANQKNAIAALQASFETTKAFGEQAAKLAMKGADLEMQKRMQRDVDKTMNVIDDLERSGQIPKDRAAALRERAVEQMIGAGEGNAERLSQERSVTSALEQAVRSGQSLDIRRGDERVTIGGGDKPPVGGGPEGGAGGSTPPVGGGDKPPVGGGSEGGAGGSTPPVGGGPARGPGAGGGRRGTSGTAVGGSGGTAADGQDGPSGGIPRAELERLKQFADDHAAYLQRLGDAYDGAVRDFSRTLSGVPVAQASPDVLASTFGALIRKPIERLGKPWRAVDPEIMTAVAINDAAARLMNSIDATARIALGHSLADWVYAQLAGAQEIRRSGNAPQIQELLEQRYRSAASPETFKDALTRALDEVSRPPPSAESFEIAFYERWINAHYAEPLDEKTGYARISVYLSWRDGQVSSERRNVLIDAPGGDRITNRLRDLGVKPRQLGVVKQLHMAEWGVGSYVGLPPRVTFSGWLDRANNVRLLPGDARFTEAFGLFKDEWIDLDFDRR